MEPAPASVGPFELGPSGLIVHGDSQSVTSVGFTDAGLQVFLSDGQVEGIGYGTLSAGWGLVLTSTGRPPSRGRRLLAIIGEVFSFGFTAWTADDGLCHLVVASTARDYCLGLPPGAPYPSWLCEAGPRLLATLHDRKALALLADAELAARAVTGLAACQSPSSFVAGRRAEALADELSAFAR